MVSTAPPQAPPVAPGERSEDDQGATCLLCEGSARPWREVPRDWRRVGRPEAERVWAIERCERCDFRFLHPRPAPEDVPGFYETDAYYTCDNASEWTAGELSLQDRVRYHLAWRKDRGAYMKASTVAAAVPAVTEGRATRVLDLGCGSGYVIKGLAELGYEVVGVEPDEPARAVASETGLTVHPGTAEDLPAAVQDASGSFDAVVMSHVLEHTLDPRAAVVAAVDLLTPGGLFLCEVPNNACFEADRAGPNWSFLDAPRHLNFFTASSLEALMEDCGARVEARHWVGYARQFAPERFENEGAIAEALAGRAVGGPGTLEVWYRLARTLLASDEARHDSVRVLARKPG